MDPEAFIEFINREKARMVIFSNPCNPTGQGLSREDVRKILASTDSSACWMRLIWISGIRASFLRCANTIIC